MPKNPHADFSPVLDGYSGIGAFRFWCQTALPLTYDDSLSYYELLNKVVNYLNHTIEDLTAVESNTSALADAYNKLQKYVNDYFDDLDVEAELRNVLDAMAEDGTLDALLDPLVENHLPGIIEEKIDDVVAEQIDGAVAGQIDESVADQLPALVDAGIPGEVSDWLEENVDPVGSAVMVDSTLTISGAAADAKVTGDKFNEIKTQLNELNNTVNGEKSFNYIEGKNLYANTTLGTHEIIDDPESCISELIPVTWEWDSTTYSRFYYTDTAVHSELYFIFFYDENENYLGYRGDDHEREYRSVLGRDNAAFVQFSFKKGFEGKLTNATNPPTITYWKAEETLVEAGVVDKIGNLNELETENKNDLVEAINEVKTEFENNYNDLSNKFDEIAENGSVIDEYRYGSSDLEWTDGVKFYNGTEYTTGSYLNYHFCYFDVQEGDIIKTATSTFRDRCEFNDGVVVSNTNITGFNTYTVPAGVDRVALTRTKSNTSDIILYRNREVITIKETALIENVGKALKETTNLLDDVKINIPEKIYAISGIELNIYFENIVEKWEEYDWNVNCSKGMQLARGYRITPINSDAGEYTLTITIRKENSEKTVTTTLIIVPSTAGSGQTVSVIILGDSTTYNGIAIEKLHDDFNDDVMTLRTMGTMGTAPNNHEGRSGWTLNDYFTKASITYPAGDPRGTIYNPFYNPDTETFDAEYYFMNSGIAEPDWFIINMGINDMFGYTTDNALDAQINTCIGYLNTIINSIHSVSNNIKVGVCITIPPNDSQDAFGKAYSCGQTRNRYKRNNTLWDNAVIAEFEGKENEGVYLIPIHVNLDTVYNMGLESIPVNSRNSKTYDSPIANGGVHPTASGYWQVADVYMAFLKGNAT